MAMTEFHRITRPATQTELNEITRQHLDTLEQIDTLTGEAKQTAKDYKDDINRQKVTELLLRQSLTNGTVTELIEVEPVPNLGTDIMDFYGPDGSRYPDLSRPLTDDEITAERRKRQLSLPFAPYAEVEPDHDDPTGHHDLHHSDADPGL